MFVDVDPKQSFPKLEEEVLKYWKQKKIFEKSIKNRPKTDEYVFYDGPPFATGLPHYGHILAGTMKDVVPRYWTMRGKRVERVFGWDCHGLPVEYQIEKELGLNGKKEIEEKMGIAAFNEACRKNVLRFTKEWEKTVERMGRWVDFQNAYRTMDLEYMESIWWVFKTLWDKGLIYEGLKPMHICPRCVTPLSNFEVGLGYKDVTDPAITLKFENEPKNYFLAWTTTPWSVLSVMGLSVGKNIDYVKVHASDGNNYIVAEKRREEVFKNTGLEYEIVEHFKGAKLVGKKFKHVFDMYNHHPLVQASKNVFTLVATDYTTDEEGTGIATINGAFGEDDMNAAKKNDIPIIRNVNMDGTFTEETERFAGKFVKNEDQNIVQYLEKNGFLLKREKYKHSYPHCWRCESPLLNYATESWFVKVEALKKDMIESNSSIHWMPSHLKEGRFGKWLENARDWCISRNRFWGTPLPIWRCGKCQNIECLGSQKELEEKTGEKIHDLHKHFVDELIYPCSKCNGTMKRIEEVLDCWFESGSMPYAQRHYPFENKEWLEKHFPADFIAEGLDQTRGWFYTLHVLATALSPQINKESKKVKPAFKNIIVNGIVLAEDGSKMSKSKKNYPDPHEVFEKYGADAVRFYLMNSPVVAAEDLRFSEKGVSDVVKNVILPIWNVYSFFVTYANIDGWDPDKKMPNKNRGPSKNKLDRWILSSLNALILEVTKEMDNYDLQAIKPIYSFLESLTNWYVRRSRRRFWKSENDDDKMQAYQTLYTVLTTLMKIIAPWMPFLSESIYRNLTNEESVHLQNWPLADKGVIDEKLNKELRITQNIVNLGRKARSKANIKVRQPLKRIELILPETMKPELRELIEDQIEAIQEELNVKKIEFLDDPSKIATAYVSPNAKILGPKYGAKVQDIIREAKKGNFERLANGGVKVLDFELSAEEIVVGYQGKAGFDVEYDQGIVLALDTTITEELKNEGIARDLVRFIQDMRKEAGYELTDRIIVSIEASEKFLKQIKPFEDYIKKETLAKEIKKEIKTELESAEKEEKMKIEGEEIKIGLKKI